MDEMIAKFKTPESCEQFAINVREREPERAREALRRAVALRAEAHGAATAAEREAIQAVYAYERALQQIRGKKVRASRTWQMIDRIGIIQAVEKVVARPSTSQGYDALAQIGMTDMAFEAVVLRHPHLFSPQAIEQSRRRLAEWSRV